LIEEQIKLFAFVARAKRNHADAFSFPVVLFLERTVIESGPGNSANLNIPPPDLVSSSGFQP